MDLLIFACEVRQVMCVSRKSGSSGHVGTKALFTLSRRQHLRREPTPRLKIWGHNISTMFELGNITPAPCSIWPNISPVAFTSWHNISPVPCTSTISRRHQLRGGMITRQHFSWLEPEVLAELQFAAPFAQQNLHLGPAPLHWYLGAPLHQCWSSHDIRFWPVVAAQHLGQPFLLKRIPFDVPGLHVPQVLLVWEWRRPSTCCGLPWGRWFLAFSVIEFPECERSCRRLSWCLKISSCQPTVWRADPSSASSPGNLQKSSASIRTWRKNQNNILRVRPEENQILVLSEHVITAKASKEGMERSSQKLGISNEAVISHSVSAGSWDQDWVLVRMGPRVSRLALPSILVSCYTQQ